MTLHMVRDLLFWFKVQGNLVQSSSVPCNAALQVLLWVDAPVERFSLPPELSSSLGRQIETRPALIKVCWATLRIVHKGALRVVHTHLTLIKVF